MHEAEEKAAMVARLAEVEGQAEEMRREKEAI